MALTEIDRRLLRRCLAHEPGAWKDFVDRFLGLILHVINHTAETRAMPLSGHDREDICSQVFLTLLDRDFAVLRRFQGNSSLATYLTVIARRIAVNDMLRRRHAQQFGHVTASPDSISRAAAAISPSREVDRIADRDEVDRLLEQLPPLDAEVVRLYHIEEKSYREVAEELNISIGTVGPTLTRSRELLRRLRQSRPVNV